MIELLSSLGEAEVSKDTAIAILLSGQSNMQSPGIYTDLPANLKGVLFDRNIYFMDDGQSLAGGIDETNEQSFTFSPLNEDFSNPVYSSVSGKAGYEFPLADIFHTNRNVYILKYARSATALNAWDITDPLEYMFNESLNYFKRGLAAIPESYTLGFMFFDQGESSGMTEIRMNKVIEQYRSEWTDLLWIQRKLSVNQTGVVPAVLAEGRATVDAIDISDPNFIKIDSDDVSFPDTLHMNNTGLSTISDRVLVAYNNTL